MAGYGNRTASGSMAEDLTDQHDDTRLGLTESNAPYSNGHHTYGSGMTGGAGVCLNPEILFYLDLTYLSL
jgi:hypothetical protein